MKNCLSKETLFNYYNSALDSTEMIAVKDHIENCEGCKHSLNLIIDEVSLVKNSLNDLNPRINEIPVFRINTKPVAKKVPLSKILSWAAGICLLVALSTITTKRIIDNQKPVTDYEYFEYIPDANEAWMSNSITVTSYDSQGNPINHQVITN